MAVALIPQYNILMFINDRLVLNNVFTLIGLFTALLAFSLKSFSAPELTNVVVPYDLHVYNSAGNTFVRLAAAGCSSKTYYLPTDHAQYDIIMSILIAAQISETKVQGRFDGCNANGQGKLIGIYLK